MTRPLSAIEARERATTKGPLSLTRYEHGGGRLFLEGEAGSRVLVADFYDEGNREFYSHSREDIPALCAALRIAVGFIRDEACSLKIAEDEANCCRAHEALREIAALIEVEE